MNRRRTQHGTALIEVTWLSVLLLVPLLYIIVAVFEVQRSAYAVNAATRAAARAYSMAPSQAEGSARARAAAAVAFQDQGLDLSDGSFDLGCDPAPDDCLSPGSVIHVRLAYAVPLPLVPDALGGNSPSVRVRADHAVPYGTFKEQRP